VDAHIQSTLDGVLVAGLLPWLLSCWVRSTQGWSSSKKAFETWMFHVYVVTPFAQALSEPAPSLTSRASAAFVHRWSYAWVCADAALMSEHEAQVWPNRRNRWQFYVALVGHLQPSQRGSIVRYHKCNTALRGIQISVRGDADLIFLARNGKSRSTYTI